MTNLIKLAEKEIISNLLNYLIIKIIWSSYYINSISIDLNNRDYDINLKSTVSN